MLQRVQTIWLFFATVALFALFLFPCVQVLGDLHGSAKSIKVSGIYENINGQIVQTEGFTLLTIATVIVALLPFVAIFMYQNRKRQIVICYVALILILIHSFWLVQVVKKAIHPLILEMDNYGLGLILPSLSILLVILAIKGIRRDEKLIRSADRLR